MVFGKLDSHMQKYETGPLSYTRHKNKFKMDERPKCETGNHQNLRGEHRLQLFDIGHSNFFHDTSAKARETKEKMNFWDFIQIKIFCTAKETINKPKRNGRRT